MRASPSYVGPTPIFTLTYPMERRPADHPEPQQEGQARTVAATSSKKVETLTTQEIQTRL